MIEGEVYRGMGGWWEGKGEKEIEIVGEKEVEDRGRFLEVKGKGENMEMEKVEGKGGGLMGGRGELKGYWV